MLIVSLWEAAHSALSSESERLLLVVVCLCESPACLCLRLFSISIFLCEHLVASACALSTSCELCFFFFLFFLVFSYCCIFGAVC